MTDAASGEKYENLTGQSGFSTLPEILVICYLQCSSDDDGGKDNSHDGDDDNTNDDDDDGQVRTNGPGHSNGKRGSHVSTVR